MSIYRKFGFFSALVLTSASCGSSGDELADARRIGDAPAHATDAVVARDGDNAPKDAGLSTDAHGADANADAMGGSPDATQSPFAGGTGALNDPFLISNSTELLNANNSAYAASAFQLIADIDLTGIAMQPIGTTNDSNQYGFSGIFDGNNHVISNWTYTTGGDCVGLISSLQGRVSDLILQNPTIIGNDDVGTLVGCAQGGQMIRDQVVGGTVTALAGGAAGGLLGTAEQDTLLGAVANCSSSADVSATYAGGLVAVAGSSIIDSYATGTVTSSSGFAGGLVGNNGTNPVVRSYASGAIHGQIPAGLCASSNGSITDSFWDIDTTGQSSTVGGGTGLADAAVSNSDNFTNWDFINTWSDGPGGPTLQTNSNVAPITPQLSIASMGTAATANVVTMPAYDFNGDPLSFRIITPANRGTTSVVTSNQFSYTPDGSGAYNDAVFYQVTDNAGGASPVTKLTMHIQ